MATRICTGNGDCLTQTTDVNTYGKYPDVSCSHNCQPLKCPNFLVCGSVGPKWFLDIHRGTCWTCRSKNFRNLEFSEDECPTCLDTKMCVKLLNCSHKQCVDCFRRCQWGRGQQYFGVMFPYPDLEDEYEDDPDNERWKNDEKVQKWWRDCELAEVRRQMEYETEKNLRCCPLCRK